MTDKKSTTRKPAKSRGLGRGLSALMSDVGAITDAPEDTPQKPTQSKAKRKSKTAAQSGDISDRGVSFLPLKNVQPNPDQPRRHFDKTELAALTESIKAKGVLQPILVRPIKAKSGTIYQIVAGERRYQSALAAKLTQIPALIRELSDQETLEIGVVENVQRADLNPIEEAQAYRALTEDFGRTQADIAGAVGKSRSHIANIMRLLQLPERAQAYLIDGRITSGHARAIIAAPDPVEAANMIAEKKLSVREAEDWVRRLRKGETTPPRPRAYKSADTQAVETKLTDILGLDVDLNHKGPHGELRLKYKTSGQLEDLIKRLGGS